MLVRVGIAEMGALPAEREECFGTFVALQRDRARRLAWRLVGGDEAAAEDVTQEAFVRAYQALGRFRGEASLETWFYRILVRQAHNYRRWRAVRTLWQRESVEEPIDPTSAVQSDPGLRRRIAQALDQLSRRQREAFVLVYLEGFTVQECADFLGSPSGTVKSHLHRALVKMRTELADLNDETGDATETGGA
ncbi:MAG: RNA polymerase sigma factor [Desulfurellaceae bacterium]|nr:RNA polymerase sigma factor [Desulfurellaceae bacterium]